MRAHSSRVYDTTSKLLLLIRMSLSECLSTLLQQCNVKQIFSGGNLLQSLEDDDDETRRPYLRGDLAMDGL